MTTGSSIDWSLLPSDILVNVFSLLNSNDLNHASRVCRTWNEAFSHPKIWQTFDFWFFLPSHVAYLDGARQYGKYMKRVFIGLNQMLTHNRQNACALLEVFSRIDRRRMTHLKIEFTGENPLFYSGQEFLDGLVILFSKVADNVEQPISTIQHVDLSGLAVPIDDRVIDTLSENHTRLKYLDIQNKVIISKTTSDCILRLVERCRNLLDLRLYYCSISNEVLEAFTDDNRSDIEHISIICRREVKFGYELETEAWEDLVTRIPTLRVTLGFDHTCPYPLISAIMKPVIPVRTLRLETFAICYDEVNLGASLYKKTLEKLVLQTRNSKELEAAVLNVARTCTLLRSLLVYCVLSRETIDEIFRLHPDMKERGTYILKSEVEPEPWVVGVEEGD